MGQDIAKPVTEAQSIKLGINRAAEVKWDPQKSYMISFAGKDENYGTPPEGSKTAARGAKARRHINQEISNLLLIIKNIGTIDPETKLPAVTFGRLFQYYEPISDKIVGLLLRARRWNLVDFPGEMLYQRQDNEVLIKLLHHDEPTHKDVINNVSQDAITQPEEQKNKHRESGSFGDIHFSSSLNKPTHSDRS